MKKGSSLLESQDVQAMGPKAMARAVRGCVASIHTSYYNLGALLLRVRDEGLFVNWDGVEYEFFDEWCEEVLKFRSRKAQHLITIHKKIVDLEPPSVYKRRLLDLGWAKVSQVLRIVSTVPQLKKWVKKAEGMTLRELTSKVKYEAQEGKGKTDDDVAISMVENTVNRRFKLNESQAETVDKALDILTKRFPSQSDGERLNMMALAYLSAHVRDDEGGAVIELGYLIDQLEKIYGVKLKVVQGSRKATPKALKKKKKKKVG